MTVSEFDILKALSERGGSMEWSELMNADGAVSETDGVLRLLSHSECVSGKLAPHSVIKITPIGCAYYAKLNAELNEKRSEQQYIREENAKMAAQNRVNTVISFASMVFAGASLLLGILTALKVI